MSEPIVRKAEGGSASITLGDLLYKNNPRPPSESEWVDLVRAIAGHDQRAFHTLYQRTHRIVFTLIMRIVRDSRSAEEVTLDVFHDVWRRAGEYSTEGGPVLGWILNQARSRAIDRVRFEHRKKRTNRFPGRDLAGETATGCEEARALEDHDQVVVRTALSVLTPEERAAIESAYFGELSYAEVAERLKEPLGTVKTRIRSALQKLRRALSDGGLKP